MTNQNFEFKSYIPLDNDPYMLGIAKIKLYGKVIVNFKHVKTKDGSSTFFCTQNYSIKDAAGEKKYLSCVNLDSRDDEEMLMEFIRENVNKILAQRSAHAQGSQITQGNYYPHGMAKQSLAHPISSISEVAQNDQVPF